MKRLAFSTLATVLGVGICSLSPPPPQPSASPLPVAPRMHPDSSTAPSGASRRRLPDGQQAGSAADFLPGLGTLYVDPATLPAGPFLAYDHEGHLVSSIYMIPLKDLNAQKPFSGLKVARDPVDHVDIVFNAGHPGVAEPHYHMILWYVSPERAAQLAK